MSANPLRQLADWRTAPIEKRTVLPTIVAHTSDSDISYNRESFPRRRGKTGKAHRIGHAAFADLLTYWWGTESEPLRDPGGSSCATSCRRFLSASCCSALRRRRSA